MKTLALTVFEDDAEDRYRKQVVNHLLTMPGAVLRAYQDENDPLCLHLYVEHENAKVSAGVIGVVDESAEA